jgi:hypothetical protein
VKEILLQSSEVVSLQSALKKGIQTGTKQLFKTWFSTSLYKLIFSELTKEKQLEIIFKKDEIKVGSKKRITTFALPSKQGVQRKEV